MKIKSYPGGGIASLAWSDDLHISDMNVLCIHGFVAKGPVVDNRDALDWLEQIDCSTRRYIRGQ